MMIEFSCPKCGKFFRVPPERAGQKTKCTQCKQEIQVPESSEIATAYVEPRADSPKKPAASRLPGIDWDKFRDELDKMIRSIFRHVFSWAFVRRTAWGMAFLYAGWLWFTLPGLLEKSETVWEQIAIGTVTTSKTLVGLVMAVALDRLTRWTD